MADPTFITTPIYYVNDVPHIGHAYTTVVADALARWERLLGKDVLFLTGTDEHGLKVARSAADAGRTPIAQADFASDRFREAWNLLDVSNDDFIRTTEPRHIATVQAFMQKVYDNGHIYRDTYAGWYCVSCEAYYAEDDLDENPDGGARLCRTHQRPVEWFEEDNYFFRLSAFAEPLKKLFTENPDLIRPAGKRNEALGIIEQGLEDVSISRSSLDWGIPLPWDESQVFYVWYDALINYVTAAGYLDDRPQFDRRWPVVHHLIGKDILRFHCVYWPAMLLAAGELPPHHVSVHGYLLIGGTKMSKSLFNQIAPRDLVEGDPERGFAAFGVDGFRYQLLRDQPFGPDGDFSYEGMVARYNADLANTLGNLLSRVAKVVSTKCGGIGPAPATDSVLSAVAARAVAESQAAWDAVQPSKALDAATNLLRDTNEYLTQHEPWKIDPGPAVDTVLGDAIEALRIAAVLLAPALVRSAPAIWDRLGIDGDPRTASVPNDVQWGGYPGGTPVTVGPPLFPRISA